MSNNASAIKIKKAKNGYIVEYLNEYDGRYADPDVYPTFIDAVKRLADQLGETSFAATLEESHVLSQSLSSFFGAVIKPQLTAIEAKINPGIETLVDVDHL